MFLKFLDAFGSTVWTHFVVSYNYVLITTQDLIRTSSEPPTNRSEKIQNFINSEGWLVRWTGAASSNRQPWFNPSKQQQSESRFLLQLLRHLQNNSDKIGEQSCPILYIQGTRLQAAQGSYGHICALHSVFLCCISPAWTKTTFIPPSNKCLKSRQWNMLTFGRCACCSSASLPAWCQTSQPLCP